MGGGSQQPPPGASLPLSCSAPRGTEARALRRNWGLAPPEAGAQHPQIGGSALLGGGGVAPWDLPAAPAQSPGVPGANASALWANVSATSSGKTREASA